MTSAASMKADHENVIILISTIFTSKTQRNSAFSVISAAMNTG